MNSCKRVSDIIEDFDLLKKHEQEVLEHIKNCESCRDEYESAKIVFKGLKSYRANNSPTSKEQFNESLHMKLAEARHKKSKRVPLLRKILPLGAAIATFVIIIAFSGMFSGGVDIDPKPELVSKTETETGNPVEVLLKYDADKELKNIEIHFTLDKGVTFHSEHDEINSLKKYTWKGDLKKGENQVPFIVDLNKIGRWNVSTTTRFDGFVHKHRIEFTVTEEKIVMAYYKQKIPETEEIL